MKKLDSLLPDFNDILKLIEDIRVLQLKKTLLELEIRTKISEIYIKVSDSLDYQVGGKPPSATYIKSTYEQTGLKGELVPLREKLVGYTVDLKYLENKLITLKDMIDVWRTLSANERITTI